ncbi:hypothetical protein UFOVP658_140 [uncultured Caudovirales phage]|jgi:hypothetical protein|uniref:Tail tube protein n=1 Tax=uncultured Caudovirales phage TaxID=2100421 RepID=A0A6J5NCX9_9CAUD|nr:hypothetical protein UFOVP658_140 [uncultured Caudovirales phage]
MAKVAQRQVLADIVPVATATASPPKWTNFRFAQVSGGEITASVEKIYEGGKLRPTLLCAPSEIGDITVTAHYDNDAVQSDSQTGIEEKLQKLRPLVGRALYDVTVQTYDCDVNSVVPGTGRLYKSALLVGLTEPDGDSSSGAPSTFALTFAVEDVKKA